MTLESVKAQLSYFGQLKSLPRYLYSGFEKRNPKLWVFGSTFGRRFADNPKYFYLYLNQHHKEIRAVWISKEPEIVSYLNEQGLPAYLADSKMGRRVCRKAGVYIYDNYTKDISFEDSRGAMHVNLWHGIPLKKIQMDNRFDLVRHPENLWKRIYWSVRRWSDEKPSDYVLTTSKHLRSLFASAFQTKKVLTSGYPRNDSFCFPDRLTNVLLPSEQKVFDWLRQGKNVKRSVDDEIREEGLAKGKVENNRWKEDSLGLSGLEKSKGEEAETKTRILFYMPTFRTSENLFFERTDLIKLTEFLKENKIFMVIKLHPKSKLQSEFEALASEQILLLGNQEDPYEMLKYADVLMTDYSSIYFDYLLLDRPIVFYNYDFEEYLSESRELYYDYEKLTPGYKAADGAALCQVLSKLDWERHQDGFERKRKRIREYMFDDMKEPASERLYRDICRRIHF